MKIRGIGCAMPDRVVTNEEVLALIENSSEVHLDDDLGAVLDRFRALLKFSGTCERRWRAPGERAYEFAVKAANQALDVACMKPEEIDLLLYVGVGRGWVEPGMATFFVNELKMKHATGFDILDACLSWMRAIHVAHQFIKNGVYRNVMILNAEFNQEYADFAIRSIDEIPFRFAQLTIGESATATIITNEKTDLEAYFAFKTDATRHHLCKIPLPNISSYNPNEPCPRLNPLVFFAYSKELMRAAQEMIPDLYFSTPEFQQRKTDVVFAHSASKIIIDDLARRLNISRQTVNLYPMIGNLVSASIPTAMKISVDNGRLQRGMNILMVMGSAGFSVGICHMMY